MLSTTKFPQQFVARENGEGGDVTRSAEGAFPAKFARRLALRRERLLQVVKRRHSAPTHRLFHGDNASPTHATNDGN